MTLSQNNQPQATSAQPIPFTWQQICNEQDILPGAGVCALVDGQQIAIFSLDGQFYAVGNHDPLSGANVISRGLTGSYTRDGETRLKVASPLLKHAFDLQSGEYLDDSRVKLPVYPVRTAGGAVWIGLAV